MRRIFVIVTLAATFFVSPAFADDKSNCAGNDGTVDSRIAACTRAINSGKLKRSELAAALGSRGFELAEKEEHDRVILDYNREEIRLDPKKEATAFNKRGLLYEARKDCHRAILDYNEAIRLEKHEAYFYNRGRCYAAKQDYDQAISDYSEAIRLDPKWAMALNDRGLLYSKKQDFDRAISDYNKAVGLAPKNGETFNNRGVAYHGKQDYDRAILDYNEAIRLDSEDATTFANRGTSYLAKQDYDRAISDFDESVRLNPRDENIIKAREAAVKARDLAIKSRDDLKSAKVDDGASKAHTAFRSKPEISGPAGKRIALVIGINDYPNLRTPNDPSNGQLIKAVADAELMEQTLRSLGFDVEIGRNLTRNQFLTYVNRVKKKINAGDTVFVFFAGHGVAIREANYLLPSDIPAIVEENEELLSGNAIPEGDLIRTLRQERAGLTIVVMDACRDNPVEELARLKGRTFASIFRSTPATSVGINVRPTTGVFSIYSAGAGQRALDGLREDDKTQRNSVFTRMFAGKIKETNRHLSDIMEDVKDEVRSLAFTQIDVKTGQRHVQTPAYYNETQGGRIYLANPAR